MNATPYRRGRPPLADAVELRSRALLVLLECGYGNVTMTRLAGELGMSVRTLHRYFPSKADIVWGGIEGSLDALRNGFASADEGLPIIEAIAMVVGSVFEQEADVIAVSRARLRLIAVTPELQSTRPETYRRWRQETIEFVARRLGVSADEVVPRAVGAAVQAAISEALAWWAGQDEVEAEEAVAQALHGFEIVTSGRS